MGITIMWDPFKPMLYSMLIMITLLLLANYALGSETKSQWLNDNPCMITTKTTTVEKDGVTTVTKEEVLKVAKKLQQKIHPDMNREVKTERLSQLVNEATDKIIKDDFS